MSNPISLDKPSEPLPEGKHPGGRDPLYPFGDMRVNDSFTLEAGAAGTERSTPKANPRVALAAHQYGKRNNMKFKYRTKADGSVTVWRHA